MTSCMIFSLGRSNAVWPIRLAGTWKQYSMNAMPQLARTAMTSGRVPRFFRCAYQAKVMKTFAATRRRTVLIRTGIEVPGLLAGFVQEARRASFCETLRGGRDSLWLHDTRMPD